MYISIKTLIVAASVFITVAAVALFAVSGPQANAQSASGPVITHMAGDGSAVWLATDNGQLIRCWFPQNAARASEQANCRVLERWRVNVIR